MIIKCVIDESILIGLGKHADVGRLVFLPNTPSVGLHLFKVKHLIKITPVTFPNGIPDDFSPDTHGYKLTPKGEFIVTDIPGESLDSIAGRADWMKIDNDMKSIVVESNFVSKGI